jgi:hypothetical protein
MLVEVSFESRGTLNPDCWFGRTFPDSVDLSSVLPPLSADLVVVACPAGSFLGAVAIGSSERVPRARVALCSAGHARFPKR